MPFELGPEELREMARLEEEAGCDVEAGLAWGVDAGEYLRRSGGIRYTGKGRWGIYIEPFN